MISTVRLVLFLIVLTNHITVIQSHLDQTQSGASKPSTSHSQSLSYSTSQNQSSSGPLEHSTPPNSYEHVFRGPYVLPKDADYIPEATIPIHLSVDLGNGCHKSRTGQKAAKCTCMGKEISCEEAEKVQPNKGTVPNSISKEEGKVGNLEATNKTITKRLDKFGNPRLITLTTTNVFVSVCCIVLSGFMIYFRIKTGSTKILVNTLYLQNGLADFFVGIGVLSQSPVLYLMILNGRDISGITIPIFISYFVTAVAVKMSVFLNCVLGVVRCINIVFPFYRPNKKVLTASTLLYMVVWVFTVGLDIWQFTEKINQENKALLVKTFVLKGQSGFGLVLVTKNEDQVRSSYLAYHLGNLIQFIIPTVLPTLLCFVLMIVQLYHMPKKSSSKKTRKSKNGNDRVSKASLTIFLLTGIYVITSGVSVVTWLVVHGRRGYLGSKKEFESLMKDGRTATSWSDLTVIYFSLSTCPLICSTLTPLTLLLRGTGPAFSSVRKIFTKSSSGTADTTF